MEVFDINMISDIMPLNDNYRKFKQLLDSIESKDTVKKINGSKYLMRNLEVQTFNGYRFVINLDLSNNALTDIRKGVFDNLTNLETINLSSNLISLIEDFVFENNTKLQKIFVRKNVLDTISNRVFCNLNNVTELDLSYNQIKHLPDFCIDCPLLEKLNISNNKIEQIDTRAFYLFSNLFHLKLNNNKLYALTKNMFNFLGKLQFLNLSNNFIRELFDYDFENLENLIVLKLKNNLISKIHQNTFANSVQMRYLILSNNKISTLNSSFLNPLSILRYLNLSNNLLTTINSDYFQNKLYLQSLNLSDNYFTTIIDEICVSCPNLEIFKINTRDNFNFEILQQFKSLAVFELFIKGSITFDCNFLKYINGNSIRDFKLILYKASFINFDLLTELMNLVCLHIECKRRANDENELDFAKFADKMTKLQHLVLININRLYLMKSSNGQCNETINILHLDLTGLSNRILCDHFDILPLLEYLNLSFSNISFISYHILQKLVNLKQLILKDTYIQYIKMNTFINNIKLEVIDCSNCYIKNIDNFSFEILKNLQKLDLRNNPLRSINERTFYGLPKTTKIYLS